MNVQPSLERPFPKELIFLFHPPDKYLPSLSPGNIFSPSLSFDSAWDSSQHIMHSYWFFDNLLEPLLLPIPTGLALSLITSLILLILLLFPSWSFSLGSLQSSTSYLTQLDFSFSSIHSLSSLRSRNSDCHRFSVVCFKSCRESLVKFKDLLNF